MAPGTPGQGPMGAKGFGQGAQAQYQNQPMPGGTGFQMGQDYTPKTYGSPSNMPAPGGDLNNSGHDVRVAGLPGGGGSSMGGAGQDRGFPPIGGPNLIDTRIPPSMGTGAITPTPPPPPIAPAMQPGGGYTSAPPLTGTQVPSEAPPVGGMGQGVPPPPMGSGYNAGQQLGMGIYKPTPRGTTNYGKITPGGLPPRPGMPPR